LLSYFQHKEQGQVGMRVLVLACKQVLGLALGRELELVRKLEQQQGQEHRLT